MTSSAASAKMSTSSGSMSVKDSGELLAFVDGLEYKDAKLTKFTRFKQKLERNVLPLPESVMYHEGVILSFQVMDIDKMKLKQGAMGRLARAKQTKYMKLDWCDGGLEMKIHETFPIIENVINYTSTSRYMEADLPELSPTPLFVVIHCLSSLGFNYNVVQRNCQHFANNLWDVYVSWGGQIPSPQDVSIVNKFWPQLNGREVDWRLSLLGKTFTLDDGGRIDSYALDTFTGKWPVFASQSESELIVCYIEGQERWGLAKSTNVVAEDQEITRGVKGAQVVALCVQPLGKRNMPDGLYEGPPGRSYSFRQQVEEPPNTDE